MAGGEQRGWRAGHHRQVRWAKLEDRLTGHVVAEIESQAAQWRD